MYRGSVLLFYFSEHTGAAANVQGAFDAAWTQLGRARTQAVFWQKTAPPTTETASKSPTQSTLSSMTSVGCNDNWQRDQLAFTNWFPFQQHSLAPMMQQVMVPVESYSPPLLPSPVVSNSMDNLPSPVDDKGPVFHL